MWTPVIRLSLAKKKYTFPMFFTVEFDGAYFKDHQH